MRCLKKNIFVPKNKRVTEFRQNIFEKRSDNGIPLVKRVVFSALLSVEFSEPIIKKRQSL